MSHNFIGIYENAIPDRVCDDLISFFEKCDELGFTMSRQQREGASKLHKNDDVVFASDDVTLELSRYKPFAEFVDIFWANVHPRYIDEYAVLGDIGAYKIFEHKLQRTKVGGGYHSWHCEHGNKATSTRLIAYTCYLNDVEEGGETEFLYYPKRVRPKKGTVLLFPAGFTHTHRGNPPLSNTKYIVTGWLEFYA